MRSRRPSLFAAVPGRATDHSTSVASAAAGSPVWAGFGLKLYYSQRRNALEIDDIEPGTQAYTEAGLRVGDEILEVSGVHMAGHGQLAIAEAKAALQDGIGRGETEFSWTIKRAELGTLHETVGSAASSTLPAAQQAPAHASTAPASPISDWSDLAVEEGVPPAAAAAVTANTADLEANAHKTAKKKKKAFGGLSCCAAKQPRLGSPQDVAGSQAPPAASTGMITAQDAASGLFVQGELGMSAVAPAPAVEVDPAPAVQPAPALALVPAAAAAPAPAPAPALVEVAAAEVLTPKRSQAKPQNSTAGHPQVAYGSGPPAFAVVSRADPAGFWAKEAHLPGAQPSKSLGQRTCLRSRSSRSMLTPPRVQPQVSSGRRASGRS